ncbi:MAG: type II secretion system major pseudopilin GspG [Verrucomicrobia bacterium]|nr:type II secretion system major pseudopilin GspG [Verrucomicrobiota bacterium]MDA1087827.1 type II secretion system major pseudopilin GspG [Verrucomicrobiota bacterium]
MQRNKTRHSAGVVRHAGFTLIEVLLVVVIIGILIGVAAPKLSGRVKQAQVQGTRQSIRNVSLALDTFEVDIGHYPSSIQNLLTSSGENNWNGPYLKDGRTPQDAWGVDLQYALEGDAYKLRSAGPDGQMGSGDDITN